MDGSSLETMQARLPPGVPSFQLIADCEYQLYFQSPMTARSPFLEEVFPCECRFREGRAMMHSGIPNESDEDCPDPETQACGERSNCINRTLSIECFAEDCPCGVHCRNQRFQRHQFADVEVFETPGKGFGLRSRQDLDSGQFISEYVGEVLNQRQFEQRAEEYTAHGHRHYYFMTLQKDQIIDATKKGNLSRFLNHSCNPNCATQKWIVNGRLRIGLFTLRRVKAGTELTFDYKYIRFGAKAQKCLCGEANCKGVIGDELKEARPVSSRPTSQEEDDALQAAERFSPDTGLSSYDDLALFARLLLRSEDPEFIKLLLGTLNSTTDPNTLRQYISLHGLQILNILMGLYWRDVEIIRLTATILDKLPISTRNCIEDSSLDDKVEKLIQRTDLPAEILVMCAKIHTTWSHLERVFRIPRASEVEAPAAPGTTIFSSQQVKVPMAGYSLDSNGQLLRKHRWNVPKIPERPPLAASFADVAFRKSTAESLYREDECRDHQGQKKSSWSSEAIQGRGGGEWRDGDSTLPKREVRKRMHSPPPKRPHQPGDSVFWRAPTRTEPGGGDDAEDGEMRLQKIIERAKKAALERCSKDQSAMEGPQAVERRKPEQGHGLPIAAVSPTSDAPRHDSLWTGYEKQVREEVSQIVVKYLSRWCRDQIPSSEQFKDLARKLTHRITEKEIRHARTMSSNPSRGSVAEEAVIDRRKRGKIKNYLVQYLRDHGFRIAADDVDSAGGSEQYS